MRGYEINKEDIKYEKTRRTHSSDAVQNEEELRVRGNTDIERTDSSNELRTHKDRENESRPSSRSSRSSISSRGSRKGSHVDMTKYLLNYMKERENSQRTKRGGR
jgi:hypothetical protein